MKKLILLTALSFEVLSLKAQDQTINGTTFKLNGQVGIGTANPTRILDINGSSAVLGGNFISTTFSIVAEDESGAPARTASLELKGYEGRAKGIYISDKNLVSRWFIGELYSVNGIGIGYNSMGSEVEYPAHSQFFVSVNGNVGIGTVSPDSKLTVKGDLHAREVKVDLEGAVAPDYVFERDYSLRSLKEVEAFIQENHHLPEIPSAKMMEEEGIELKQMNLLLLKKIEELTLYVIDLKKEIEELKSTQKNK